MKHADSVRFAPKPGARLGIFRSPDGLYARDFGVEDPPYVCTREEWEQFFYPSGLFDLAEKKKEIAVGDGGKGKDR